MTTVTLDLLETYRTMVTIRRFEERCLELRMRDAIAGSIHLCAGQEAIPAATMAVLGSTGRVVATYRGHGWAIACGVPLDRLLAEVCQRETGINGGRGGSAYLSAPEYGLVGENSIVGAGLPLAGGVGLAAQMLGTGAVSVVSFGDGATSQGAAHEALVFAAARQLPVIFVCEHNGWSEMTPTADIVRVARLAERATGYGMPGVTIDGNDPSAVAAAVAEAAERAQCGDGPTFLECTTARLWAHYHADQEHYRSEEDRLAAVAADPLPRVRGRLAEAGFEDAALVTVEAEVAGAIDAATADVLAARPPDPSTARTHVVALPAGRLTGPASAAGAAELTYSQAVNAALRRELAERPDVVLFGEDIAMPGGVFGVTRGLQGEFGEARVFDTPIAESAILGAAVGAAMEGLRPIVEIMWADFMLVGIDQLINQAANVRYLSRGKRSAPLVVRCQQGVTPGSCAQHSQSLEALLCHIPGLKVGLPATAHDAYAMLRAAVADDDPCIVIEARGLYRSRRSGRCGRAARGRRRCAPAARRRRGRDRDVGAHAAHRHGRSRAPRRRGNRGLGARPALARSARPCRAEARRRGNRTGGRRARGQCHRWFRRGGRRLDRRILLRRARRARHASGHARCAPTLCALPAGRARPGRGAPRRCRPRSGPRGCDVGGSGCQRRRLQARVHREARPNRRSAEFLSEPDEESSWPTDVAEPVHVFVLDHLAADKLGAVLVEPGERLVDVVHGEHDA